jgi:methionyl-tRNA formyltransferase
MNSDKPDNTEVVFLGINDTGRKIYEWLCNQSDVEVRALLTTEAQLSIIPELQPDIVVAAGYRHILPDSILGIPDKGCVNVHPGYLPNGRGFYPNVWSIIEDCPAGATIHYMDSGIDTGPIIARKKIKKQFDDNAASLYERIEMASVQLFKRYWSDIKSCTTTTTEQFKEEGTYHSRADFEEVCRLDPSATHTVREMVDRLRALTHPPHENAVIEVDGDAYHVEISVTPIDNR